MAVPKRKTSHQAKNKRRSHLRLKNPAIIKCGNCGATARPHRICGECGFYKNKEIIEVKD